jgi:hypothetical protein
MVLTHKLTPVSGDVLLSDKPFLTERKAETRTYAVADMAPLPGLIFFQK